jgi:L-arabonate dehydrase
MIMLDVANRSINLEVDEATLAARRREWKPPASATRGYVKLYVEHVQQANKGADLDFLVGKSGSAVPRNSH